MADAEHVTATVTRGGKLHLPASVMKSLGVSPGQQLMFYVKPGRALVVPMSHAIKPQSF